MSTKSQIMANKRFGYLMLAAFIAAAILLLIINYNFSGSMTTMRSGNEKLLRELRASNHLREIDRDILGVESRIRAAIATDDTSHLEGVDSKIAEVMAYLDSINTEDTDQLTVVHLKRLSTLAEQKLRIKGELMKRYVAIGDMNDTSFIANPAARRTSDEITSITHKIYDARQKKMVDLSRNIIKGGQRAQLYSNILIVFMFASGVGLCLFIFKQFRQQSKLIAQLDSSERRAREALQVKENFLANMSHEIRTPLTAILGFTNVLKRRELQPEAGEFVNSIEQAGENLLSIINDILDLSKIEAGMMRIVIAPFSVRGLLHSIETLFRERIKEKGLSFHSQVDENVADTLLGDATRLTQILVNLIGNALKFSDKGKIEVEFYLKELSGNQLKLGVRVKDAGIGISEEKLIHIFDRFNQAEEFITRNYGGTGLGLSIVKNLIQLQGGAITVKSSPGQGTEFDFYIPYVVSEEQIGHEPIVEGAQIKALIDPSLHLLVVDDNVMNQSLMSHLLTEWNASFTVVSNGLEAIEVLGKQPFDLVLMDIQMPGMDGYTATRQIRDELRLDIPVIGMTAHAMAGEREKCISHGMNDYLSKPINEDLLFKTINKYKQKKLLDLRYMKDISKGNVQYEKTVTEQFIRLIPEDLRALRSAFEGKDLNEIRRIAHNMKTSVSIMGLLPLLENLLDDLEQADVIDLELLNALEELDLICLRAVQEAKRL